MRTHLPIVLTVALLSGCATTQSEPGNPPANAESPANQPAASAPPAADRQAILSMAGEYKVSFQFEETVPLVAGYQRREPKRTGADEAVIVVEDSGDHIVLQHLLVVGDGEVIKHWRQDWTWEAGHRLEFVADQTWRRVKLPANDTAGAWTQCVYGVADTPRYCGTGDWTHRYGQATWTSDRTWRPLPRREYTTRDDYNALNVENRHTITPDGWTHEQDNSKVVRADGETREVLVREFGFNHYRRNPEFDFSPAYSYWDDTREYWARVRETWQRHFDAGGVYLDTPLSGQPVIDGLRELAEAAREGQRPDAAAIRAVFDAHVREVDPRALAGQ